MNYRPLVTGPIVTLNGHILLQVCLSFLKEDLWDGTSSIMTLSHLLYILQYNTGDPIAEYMRCALYNIVTLPVLLHFNAHARQFFIYKETEKM